jgi:predicted permease
MTRKERPPRLGRLLLWLQPLGNRREEVEADLLKLFDLRVAECGRRSAAWRYCLDALSVWRLWGRPDVRVGVRAMCPQRSWFTGAGQDVVFASRLFKREPALFSLTVAGVALAIGITASIFGVVDAVMNRNFGIPEPESVYRITVGRGTSGGGGPWRYGDYLRINSATRSSSVAARLNGFMQLGERPADEGPSRYINVGAVTGGFFSVMGGHASLGRVLGDDDDRPGVAPVVVLSDRFWRSAFGADRAVIGRTIRIQRELFTIVGVAAKGFIAASDQLPACWLSLTSYAELQERQLASEFDRRLLNVDVFGTLRSHLAQSAVEAEATAVILTATAERGLVDADARPRIVVSSVAERDYDNSFEVFGASVIMTIVAMVIVLASVNVANLLLASAAARGREIGVRLTLGASRLRIVRQLLTESLLLGLLGGGAGLALAWWTTPLLARLLDVPEMLDVAPGWRVLRFSALVTIGVGLVAGLAPARYGRRGALLPAMNTDTPAATSATTGRLRAVLVSGQAAVSIVLLVCAALLVRALVEVSHFDLGLSANRLVRVSANFRNSYADGSARAYLDAAQDRLRLVPGVDGVSLALMGPFERGYAPMRVGPQTGRTVRGYLRGEPAVEVVRNETSADYFATIGANIVRGRSYTADEVRSTAPVAVISESLARKFWPGEDPIGSSLTRVWGDEIPATGRPMGFLRKPVGTRIVGVVSETVTRLRSYDSPALYLPLDPLEARRARLIVRTTGNPQGVMAGIRDTLKAIDPEVDIQFAFVSDGLREQMRYPKSFAVIAGVFGGSTLLLAVIGLFGVTAFVIRQRRREVSVRLALGATGADMVRMLLTDSLRPVVIGITCGLLLSLIAGHVIRGMLYGVSGHDPISIVSAILILLAAATAAALGPARRALRIDPAEMLKQS